MKKDQEQDRLVHTLVDQEQDRLAHTHGRDRGRGQQVGEEEQGEGQEDKRDVRRRRK
jgi:hypothetical protein